MSSLKAWLTTDNPQSRQQAACCRLYRSWLTFSSDRIALASLFIVLGLIVLSIGAPWLATHDPAAQDLGNRLAPPSRDHWLGTDELGRDLYSRLLYGGRVTFGMVVAVVILVAPIGLAVGTVAGYMGGLVDRALMRVTDIFLAFPKLILALAFVAALRPGVTSAVIAVALTSWPAYARLARAETLVIRRADYISAVYLMGVSRTRIIARHITPMCMSTLLVRVTLDMSGIILTVAGLGFLGMGAQPPIPEWGTMIATTQGFILDQWWVPTIPGIAIFIAAMAFNTLGDGLRDALNPRQG